MRFMINLSVRNREDNKHASHRSTDENQYSHFSHRDATAGRELFPRWLRDNSGSTTVRGKKTSQNQSMVSVPKYRGLEEYAESVEEEDVSFAEDVVIVTRRRRTNQLSGGTILLQLCRWFSHMVSSTLQLDPGGPQESNIRLQVCWRCISRMQTMECDITLLISQWPTRYSLRSSWWLTKLYIMLRWPA